MALNTQNSIGVELIQSDTRFVIVGGETNQEANLGLEDADIVLSAQTSLQGPSQLVFQNAEGVVAITTDLTGSTGSSGTSGSSGISGSSGTSGLKYFQVSAFTGTQLTLNSTNTGYYIRANNANPITISIITESTNPFSDNSEIMVEQAGAGQVTFSANTTTINTATTLKTRAQYSVVGLKRVSTGTWTLFGDTKS